MRITLSKGHKLITLSKGHKLITLSKGHKLILTPSPPLPFAHDG